MKLRTCWMACWVACLNLGLAGCGTAPPKATSPAAPSSSPSGQTTAGPRLDAPPSALVGKAASPLPAAPSPPGPLAAELQWLAELFKGTPVQVVGESAGSAVRLEVPLRFAFDAGSNQPKPPLQAVLQRVGQSLKRQPTARLAMAAPGPGANERQRAMQSQLLTMGLAAHRVSVPAEKMGSTSAVQLHLMVATAAIQRLHDVHLPAVPAGNVVAPAVPTVNVVAPAVPTGNAVAPAVR